MGEFQRARAAVMESAIRRCLEELQEGARSLGRLDLWCMVLHLEASVAWAIVVVKVHYMREA